MKRRLIRIVLAFAIAIAASASRPVAPALVAQHEEPTSPRGTAPLTFLQINDVYSTIPVDGLGGLPRVATLKRQLAAAGRTPLLVIAGDLISPSVASSIFKGEQMVAALNAAGMDLGTLGNHEFDFGYDVLLQRMAEAKWQWVISNVLDEKTGKPVGNAAPYVIKTFGPLKVGFIGLCITGDEISTDRLAGLQLIPPADAAATYLPILKNEGANFIVAITHLVFAEDRALAQRFPEIDLILGGHEHYPITATENRTLISKAGSDAKNVARIDVNRRPDGMVERFYELVPITSALADDPRTASIVNDYEARLSTELDAVVGTTRAGLDANTVRLRASETNLGDLVADAMRADVGADVAIVNGGGIRGDRIYPAGPLSRRTLIAMLPFGNVVCKIAAPGRVILDALNNGASRLPASDGRFPQISGMTMRVDPSAPVGSRISDVKVDGQPLDLEKTYTIAMTDYQMKGGDGYDMFTNQRVLIGPEAGPLASSTLENYVKARGEVNPAVDGRITIAR